MGPLYADRPARQATVQFLEAEHLLLVGEGEHMGVYIDKIGLSRAAVQRDFSREKHKNGPGGPPFLHLASADAYTPNLSLFVPYINWNAFLNPFQEYVLV